MCDKWKHVSVGACIWIIVFVLVAMCVVFVPFSIGFDAETILTYKVLPVIGNGTFSFYTNSAIQGLCDILTLSDPVQDIFVWFFNNSVYFYFIILFADLIFAITLAIFRLKIMRVIYKCVSVILGFAALIISLSFLAYISGLVSFHFGTDTFSNFPHFFFTSGLLPNLVLFVASFILAAKQFKWFSKPYKIFS